MGFIKYTSLLGPWELVSHEPIFGTRKKGYRPELAISGGHADLKFQDTEDLCCETGHNALFEGPDGKLWSSCHYIMYEKRPYPIVQTSRTGRKHHKWDLNPCITKMQVLYQGTNLD